MHRSDDAHVTILLFQGFGHGVGTGEIYEQHYSSIIRTRRGRIVHYRDYWNPLAILAAIKGPSIAAAVTVDMDRGSAHPRHRR